MRNFIFFLFFIMTSFSWSQDLVINELDCDSAISEDLEFIEIKSPMPNQTISNRIIVFFNGSSSGNDSSYFLIDLDGQVTDGNGLLTIGSTSVTPVPQLFIPGNTIQNGADAVAIYEGVPDDFPDRTPATITNLVDVLVYDTSDADDEGLLTVFRADPRFSNLQQINEGSSNNPNSIQRDTDGTYFVGTPSPRQTNDGSGEIFNPISINTDKSTYEEGETVVITFNSVDPIESTFSFSIDVTNSGFDSADFTGNTNLTFNAGETTISTSLVLNSNDGNEGDEELEIKFSNLNEPIIPFNDFVIARVVDGDIVQRQWGTPLEPTRGLVNSTQPTDYYITLDGKSGQDLRDAITAIIADENTVRTHSYADIYNVLEEADENPENTNQVWLLYTEQGRSKLDRQNSNVNIGKWNREHTFPRSRGDFNEDEDFDEVATGINVFIETSVDSLRHGYSDAHALRAADALENSTRNNKNYGNVLGPESYNGFIKPDMTVTTSFRGDVARSTMYMELRYNGLTVVNGFPSLPFPRTGELGDLATLLQWHEDDAPDDFEMNRNNIVYEWQRNRNPFIDLPDLVDFVFGSRQNEVYNLALSITENESNSFTFYPNPTNNRLTFEGLNSDASVEVFSIEGRKISTLDLDINFSAGLNLSSGIYLLKVKQNETILTKRLVIK